MKDHRFNIIKDGDCELVIPTTIKAHRDGHIYLSIDGSPVLLHRHIYEQHNGSIPEGFIIRHKCDKPNCIHLKHLELGTHQENVADRVARNRSAIGSKNGRSKLNEEQVREIKSSTLGRTELARTYGVDRKVIYNILEGNTWKHVT